MLKDWRWWTIMVAGYLLLLAPEPFTFAARGFVVGLLGTGLWMHFLRDA